MKGFTLSRHAIQRLGQRSISEADVDLVIGLGTEVQDGYLMMERDCQILVEALKRDIQRIQRLSGKRVVIDGSHVVTAFRALPREERRLVRGAERRLLERRG
jgi:hypothetical protein